MLIINICRHELMPINAIDSINIQGWKRCSHSWCLLIYQDPWWYRQLCQQVQEKPGWPSVAPMSGSGHGLIVSLETSLEAAEEVVHCQLLIQDLHWQLQMKEEGKYMHLANQHSLCLQWAATLQNWQHATAASFNFVTNCWKCSSSTYVKLSASQVLPLTIPAFKDEVTAQSAWCLSAYQDPGLDERRTCQQLHWKEKPSGG